MISILICQAERIKFVLTYDVRRTRDWRRTYY
jgi:hypothetical protein